METICKRFVLLLFLSLSFVTGTATAQGWQWGRGSGGADGEAYPIATDPFGNVFGLLAKTADTGIVTFGGVSGPAAFPGTTQCVWVKYNNAGTPLWAGGNISGNAAVNAIAADNAGNLIVYGAFHDSVRIGSFDLLTGPSGYEYFIAKIDPAGNALWAISDANCYLLFGDAVTTDSSGNIYVTGVATAMGGSPVTIGTYTLTGDVYVAKYTPAGTLAWASSIGTQSASGIAVTPGGSVYVCGTFDDPSVSVGSSVIYNPYTHPIVYVAELSATGAPLWAQGAGGSHSAYAAGIVSDNSGDIYMSGFFNDTSITFGTTTLTKTYPGLSSALFLVKYAPAHSVDWCKTIGSASQDVKGWSIALTQCGQVWVSGSYLQDANIDGSILPVPSSAYDPSFIAGYDFGGSVVGYAGLRSGGDDQNSIACDRSGNVFLCGDYWTNNLIIGPDTLVSPSPLYEYLFMGKYGLAVSTSYVHTDTTVCNADSVTLSAPAGYNTYVWNSGASTQTAKVPTGGTHWVNCSACGSTLVDTFHITVQPDSVFSHSDTSVCKVSQLISVTLTAAAGTGYTWGSGDTTGAIVIHNMGDYWVDYHTGCTVHSDTFHVLITALPGTIIGSDTICLGDTSQYVDATSGGWWQSSAPGIATIDSNTGKAMGLATGTVTISYMTAAGCFITRSVVVSSSPCISAVNEVGGNTTQIEMYPNPATTELTIDASRVIMGLSISNMLGQVVYSHDYGTRHVHIDISSLPIGVYAVKINGAEVRKFVKE